MRNRLLIMLLGISLSLTAQNVFTRDTEQNKFLFGLYPTIGYEKFEIEAPPKENLKTLSIDLKPYFAYNLYNNLYLGCNLAYEFFESDFYKRDSYKEIGVFARYVVPYTLDKTFLRRFHLYAEVGYNRTNFLHVSDVQNTFVYKTIKIDERFITKDGLHYSKLSIPIGLSFHATNKLFLDVNWQYIKFIDGINSNTLQFGIGFSI